MGCNRVKPEQASKVLMRMPTLRSFGEGRTCGESIDTRTHAIRRGSGHGTSEGWFAVTGGDPPRWRLRRWPPHRISGDRWADDVRLSDLEPRFICKACADVRPDW